MPRPPAKPGPLIQRHDKGKERTWHMICAEDFTPTELAPYKLALDAMHIKILPADMAAPLGNDLQTKAQVIEQLQKLTGYLEARANKLTEQTTAQAGTG